MSQEAWWMEWESWDTDPEDEKGGEGE